MKHCTKCEILKPLDSFYKNSGFASGRDSKCKECAKSYQRKYQRDNQKERSKYNKVYYRENKEYLNHQQHLYERHRYNNDIEHRLFITLKSGLERSYNTLDIKGSAAKEIVTQYLGCSILECKQFIESKFKEGMSWDNHGEWHLDHIIPIMALKKGEYTIEQIQHYTNFQPLWQDENLLKEEADRLKYK